jgi:Lipid A 3-O-deacylase (PagL)
VNKSNFDRANRPVRSQRSFGLFGDGNSRYLALKAHVAAAALSRIGFILLLGCAIEVPQSANAHAFCESCEVQVGLGQTYHYWATTGSLVLPVSVSWSDNRYEFGAFRFTSEQLLRWPGTRDERHMADPYWGTSLSRRWHLFDLGSIQGYLGLGLSVKTEADVLSVTKWDFASQVGIRFHLPGSRVIADITMRHWSNAGIQLPNHGQDFATVTVRITPRLFGVSEAVEIPLDPTLDLNQKLIDYNARKDQALVP